MTHLIKVFFLAFLCLSGNLFGQNDTLRLLTWNIFMRPRTVFHDYQLDRAKAIVEELQKDDNEVIVFQEVFDKKARKIITEGLKNQYPYQFGPGKKGIFKLNSGVMILSKYEITQQAMQRYKSCKGADCMAKKAAVFAEISIKDKKIHVIGTHLQASQGEEFWPIRKNQLKEMAALSNTHRKKEIPLVFTGDMNIKQKDKQAYTTMLKELGAKDFELEGEIQTTSWDSTLDISMHRTSKPKRIDYILLQEDEHSANIFREEVITYKSSLPNDKKDLSDHRAVKAWIVY